MSKQSMVLLADMPLAHARISNISVLADPRHVGLSVDLPPGATDQLDAVPVCRVSKSQCQSYPGGSAIRSPAGRDMSHRALA